MEVSSIILLGAAVAVVLAAAALIGRSPTIPKLAFGLGMIVFVAESYFTWRSMKAISIEDESTWLKWRLACTSLLPGIWILFSLTYARGNYREFIARWRWLVGAAVLVPTAIAIAGFDFLAFPVSRWDGGREGLVMGWAGNSIQLSFLVGAVLVLMNLERTFRSAVGVMRWRLKYKALGVAVIFGERVYSSSQAFLLSVAQRAEFLIDALALVMGGGLIAVGVMRAGFFKVDVYPSHAFLSNSITAVFVGGYLLMVGLFAKLVQTHGIANWELWQAAVVIALLVALGVVLSSERVRQIFRVFVSRHLHRPSYDYRQIWTRFTERTGSVVEPGEYARATVKWISEVCQILSVTLWITDESRRRLTLGASTSLDESAAATLAAGIKLGGAGVLDELRQRAEPFDIDAASDPFAEALRQCNPDQFRTGGHRVCLPLLARGQIVGALVVGDRVSGRPYTTEDSDLLRCLADQVASALLNFRLSSRVIEGKQMEAFQAMSAFFVHDLKNTASTLSLMLKNLPVHFDNPEFRKDALRAIGKTVDHINDLIQRLGMLRRELEIRPTETDLNELMESSLAAVQGVPGVRLTKRLGDTPPVLADREQLGKVLVNLLLNAREALPEGGGEITVETACDEDWVLIVVRDDGCGMSHEFAEKQLFRPFQTTKKKGIGIGMFQSRMIVEAHNGRMEVETEAGRGTAFRVFLPLQRKEE